MFLTLLFVLFSFSGELPVCLLHSFFARTTSLPIIAANHDAKALGGGLLMVCRYGSAFRGFAVLFLFFSRTTSLPIIC